MAKVRQDAWSHEDDLLLAETVLRHVREGSTQLKAFEEVGDQLNRTSAACGFRWNAEVRGNYIDAMELAKRQRKERKRALAKKTSQVPSYSPQPPEQIPSDEITIDTVIHFLQQLKEDYHSSHKTKLSINHLQSENDNLNNQIEELNSKLKHTENQLNTIKEDYETFIQIMERARKMTVFNEDSTMKSPSFRMDKNGNLQQIIQGLN